MPTPPQGSGRIFDYTDEAPASWPALLDQIKNTGAKEINSRIPWGAHESMRGIRDYSKSSRLRLEKFLGYAEERGLTVNLQVGFFPSPETFPSWTFSLSEKTLVSLDAWDNRGDGFVLTEIPSFENSEFCTAFLEFIDEVFSMVALYRKPEGPVKEISINFGIYRASLNLLESPNYSEVLSRRYGNIEKLNMLYNTSFRNFEAPSSRAGGRVLGDKRAWLAAYDYKWCREEFLASWLAQIGELPNAPLVRDLLKRNPLNTLQRKGAARWTVLQDCVLVEPNEQGASPFFPGGTFTPAANVAFRLYEYLKMHCEEAAVGFGLLSHNLIEPLEDFLTVVACGKYLSRTHFLKLKSHVMQGGQILFPLGMPQYDEEMIRLEWGVEKDRIKSDEIIFYRFKEGAGNYWVPETHLTFEDNLWDCLRKHVGIVAQVGRT